MVNMNWKYCISYFFTSVANSRIYAVGSKLINLWEVLLLGIIFFIVCVVIDKNFVDMDGDDLFQKSSVIKEYRDMNLLISDRNKLAVDIFRKCERAKK